MKKRHFFGGYLIGACILGSVSASAATFNVNVFDDPAPQAAPNGCSNASINGGRCSLREAVLAANFDSAEDDIVLQAGTYTLTILEAGSPETGDLDIFGPSAQTGNTNIRGAGADATVIEAAPSLQDRILEIETGFTTEVEISDLTVQKGRSTSLGGGIYGHGNILSLKLTNVNMKDNQSTSSGGALYLGAGTSSFSMKGGTISDSRASGTGGAFNLPGGGDPKTQFQLENVIFTNNQTSNGNGGAIFHTASPGLVLSSVQFLNNTAVNGSGGGVFSTQAIGPDPSIPLSIEIKNSLFRDNKSTSHGGGAFIGATNRVNVENSAFIHNEVLGAGNGGGVYTSMAPADFFVQGNTFSANIADQGGGLWHSAAPATIREILNSTFSGNQARVAGGGIWINRGDSFIIGNVTVVGNTAPTAGGIRNEGSGPINISNSLLFQNDATAAASDDCSGNFDSLDYNIFGSPNNADCQPDAQSNPTDKFSPVDPLIASLADNGGPTQTHALLPGSPALNGGNPAGCKEQDGSTNLATDQRGQVRPLGGRCDIGAVEQGSADLEIAKSANPAGTAVGDNFDYTLTVKNNGPDPVLKATVTDTLPSGLSFVASASAECSAASGTVTCIVNNLASGASASLVFTVRVDVAGDVTNTASVKGSETDPTAGNDSADVTSTVGGGSGGGGCRLASSGESKFSPLLLVSLLGLLVVSFFGIRIFAKLVKESHVTPGRNQNHENRHRDSGRSFDLSSPSPFSGERLHGHSDR